MRGSFVELIHSPASREEYNNSYHVVHVPFVVVVHTDNECLQDIFRGDFLIFLVLFCLWIAGQFIYSPKQRL
eukprot:m.123548 g.123548  ORF g.123548 m.123548 type:complete len:72 (+) comp9412_c1_seq3:2500-2715(+)